MSASVICYRMPGEDSCTGQQSCRVRAIAAGWHQTATAWRTETACSFYKVWLRVGTARGVIHICMLAATMPGLACRAGASAAHMAHNLQDLNSRPMLARP